MSKSRRIMYASTRTGRQNRERYAYLVSLVQARCHLVDWCEGKRQQAKNTTKVPKHCSNGLAGGLNTDWTKRA